VHLTPEELVFVIGSIPTAVLDDKSLRALRTVQDRLRTVWGLNTCRGSLGFAWAEAAPAAGELGACRECGHEVPGTPHWTSDRVVIAAHGAACKVP
jgi:hypothetical protein